MELAGLRGDVALVSREFRLSDRTACKLLGVERSSYRYEPRPDRNAELREALVQLARQKPRYGYRRLHALLSRRGHEVKVKRIYRLYVEQGLMVRRKKRKCLVRERTAEDWKVGLVHIQPGRPMQNGHVESFHGRLRDECLNASWFRTLNDVRCTLATWRQEYNCERPHSSLDYRTPNEFRKTLGGRGAMAPLPPPTTTINTTEKTLVMHG
jgi:transposase InsO family protein